MLEAACCFLSGGPGKVLLCGAVWYGLFMIALQASNCFRSFVRACLRQDLWRHSHGACDFLCIDVVAKFDRLCWEPGVTGSKCHVSLGLQASIFFVWTISVCTRCVTMGDSWKIASRCRRNQKIRTTCPTDVGFLQTDWWLQTCESGSSTQFRCCLAACRLWLASWTLFAGYGPANLGDMAYHDKRRAVPG